jgi:hypothetical protein
MNATNGKILPIGWRSLRRGGDQGVDGGFLGAPQRGQTMETLQRPKQIPTNGNTFPLSPLGARSGECFTKSGISHAFNQLIDKGFMPNGPFMPVGVVPRIGRIAYFGPLDINPGALRPCLLEFQ